MSKDARFWRNVALIGLAHVALVTGLVRWSRQTKNPTQSIVWMNGGAGNGAAVEAKATAAPKPVKVSTPPPEPKPPRNEEPDEERPLLTSAKSDIQLPTPSPTASPKTSPTPKAKVTPKPSPKPTPKPSPKPTPKPSPKKTVLAKAVPKPSPKVKATPAETNEADNEADAEAMKKEIAKAKAVLEKKDSGDAPSDATDKPVKKAIATHTGSGTGTSAGAGGHAGGAGGASEFGWYGSMLHDRFYSEWVQPTTVIGSNAKISALVKIRIEKDGRVSSFEIIKPSGNAMVDESVGAVAKRVTQVDPLPAGLGSGEHYDVKINFELNSEQ